MTPERLEEIKKLRYAAHAMVSSLCRGDKKWIMSIPANEQSDPDLVIGRALCAMDELITAVEEAWAEAERLKATLDGDPSQMASPELRRAWRASAVRYADKVEAERDKWMGQFDEAEHRGLAYMEERDKLESMFAGLTDWINVEARECGVAEAKRPNNSELRSVIRGIVDRLRGQTDKLAAKLKEYEAFNEPLRRTYNENTAEEVTP